MTVYCPDHSTELDGGPVRYRCRHGHGVMAADIDHDYRPGRRQL